MILRSDLDSGRLGVVVEGGFQYPQFPMAHDLAEVLLGLQEG